MEEKIAVILVNYNGKKYNNKCIESILNSTIKLYLQIIVVDNASTDGSLDILREKWKDNGQVTILPLGQNYGFSKANNEGIRWAKEHEIYYCLLLNNDTEIKDDAIEQMMLLYKEKEAIIVPKIYYADRPDIIWCAGGKISKVLLQSYQYGLNQKDSGQYDINKSCTFANGCCIFLSQKIISQIGMLDNDYFLYHEDTEYSLRAQKAGVEIWYCASAVVYHKVNGSSKGNENPDNAYYMARNWLICNRKYLGKIFFVFLLYFFINRMTWIVIWLLQGKINMVKATFQGIIDFGKKRVGRRK